MSTPIDLGIAASGQSSAAQQSTTPVAAGTYINFGAGWIDAPSSLVTSPSQAETPTSTTSAEGSGGAGSMSPGGASGGDNTLIWVMVGGFALLAVLLMRKK